MKKIKLLFFVLISFTLASKAQFNKGSLLMGADLGFSTSTSTSGNNESKAHGFYFSPTVAVATKQNTFWGGSISAGYSKNESDPNNAIQKNNNYGASVFCRKYKPIIGKLYGFVQGGVGAGVGKTKNETGADFWFETKNFNIGLNITPGISVNVSKKVYLEAGFSNIASVNYNSNKSTTYNFGNTTKGESSGFGFSSSLGSFSNNLYFGFRFIIPKG